MGHLKPRRNTPTVLLSKHDWVGVELDVHREEEGVFFEDLSGQILQDDELARLLTFPNVLITAHQAFLTHEALAEIARVTVTHTLYSAYAPMRDQTSQRAVSG